MSGTQQVGIIELGDICAALRARSLDLFEAVPFGSRQELANGFSFTYRHAGHLLGAASVELGIEEKRRTLRLLFSGDLGRVGAVLAKDPDPPPNADFLVVESTYGNRSHASVSILDQLETVPPEQAEEMEMWLDQAELDLANIKQAVWRADQRILDLGNAAERTREDIEIWEEIVAETFEED